MGRSDFGIYFAVAMLIAAIITVGGLVRDIEQANANITELQRRWCEDQAKAYGDWAAAHFDGRDCIIRDGESHVVVNTVTLSHRD